MTRYHVELLFGAHWTANTFEAADSAAAWEFACRLRRELGAVAVTCRVAP